MDVVLSPNRASFALQMDHCSSHLTTDFSHGLPQPLFPPQGFPQQIGFMANFGANHQALLLGMQRSGRNLGNRPGNSKLGIRKNKPRDSTNEGTEENGDTSRNSSNGEDGHNGNGVLRDCN